MSSKLIVALDFNQEIQALKLVDQLNPTQCALKVGNELFTLLGPSFVKKLVSKNFNVFLDLKFHDIPNTVARACKVAADLGVWMMNVHASGGLAMMKAAKKALEGFGTNSPILIAVTILTSFTEEELNQIGFNTSVMEQVIQLASLAREAQLDGVVCSAYEAALIKEKYGAQFKTVTPGIRLDNDSWQDQARVMRPQEAVRKGCDYLVVGRTITQASDPAQVVSHILSGIE